MSNVSEIIIVLDHLKTGAQVFMKGMMWCLEFASQWSCQVGESARWAMVIIEAGWWVHGGSL